jgi:hypothetical protein
MLKIGVYHSLNINTIMKTISQKLNRFAKLNYSHSQAHKDLSKDLNGMSFVQFSEIWDMSKNVKGDVNFKTLERFLIGYQIGYKVAQFDSTKAEKQTAKA